LAASNTKTSVLPPETKRLSQMCNILGLGLFLEMTALRATDAVHARLAVPASGRAMNF
jgi:hypothetical protein